MKKVAVYPGSFDPITNGHVDIIQRGLKMFDKLIVLVAYNPSKQSLFPVEERMSMIKEIIGNNRLGVDCWSGLLVDYVKKSEANVVIRGLRALSDFENEFQMALMNRKLNRDMETVFLMTGFQWFYTSSRLIKEVASLGGNVKGLVPDLAYQKLQEKFPNNKKETRKCKSKG
jgi:pantetheine-phosphate adenylyltransferase